MDKLLALICLVVVLAFLAACTVYLRMDKLRFQAYAFLNHLYDAFEQWLNEAYAVFEHELGKLDEYNTLVSRLNNLGKREKQDAVIYMNKIHTLIKNVVSDNLDNQDIVRIGHRLTDVFLSFLDSQTGYNNCVIKLNRLLNGRITGVVGRLFLIKGLDKLDDLSVL